MRLKNIIYNIQHREAKCIKAFNFLFVKQTRKLFNLMFINGGMCIDENTMYTIEYLMYINKHQQNKWTPF